MARLGAFIAVEGGEGVGKTVFTAGLAARLRASGRTLQVSREPGGTPVADAVRQLFATPPGGEQLTIEAEALLVSASRAQHVQHVVKPALASGTWVLCDRFVDSTRVYQGTLGGLADAAVEALIQIATGGLRPDLTFILDCPVPVSLQRLDQRRLDRQHAVERYDAAQADVHERRRQAYLQLLRRGPERRVLIDAAQSPQAMLAAAWQAVETHCGQI